MKEGGLGLRCWGKIKLLGDSRFTIAKLDLLSKVKAGEAKEGVGDGAGYLPFFCLASSVFLYAERGFRHVMS